MSSRVAGIRGGRIRDVIVKELDKVIRKGARGVIMVNPDGFVFLSAGDVTPTDETLAAYMMVLFPKARNQMKISLRQSLGALLHKDAEILDLLGNIMLTFADQQYVGVYAEDYAILASVKEGADIQELRASLVRAIIEVIRELRMLKEITALPVTPAPVPAEEAASYSAAPTAYLPVAPTREAEEKFKTPKDIYQDVKAIILEMRRNLRTKGDWNSALSGLEKLLVDLTLLVDKFPEYGENPAIRSILDWVSTTLERLRRGAASSGQKLIPDAHREKLEKSLIQILNYLRRILLLGGG